MDLNQLRGGLVVSCQAHYDHPLRNPEYITAMAKSANQGGAVGIRAEGVADIHKIKQSVDLPLIGIYKKPLNRDRFFITPDYEHAKQIVEAGADLVALEATFENQPDEQQLGQFIKDVQTKLGTPVMADISSFEEGIRAWRLGADLVGTTLSGYTELSKNEPAPNLNLVKRLAEAGVKVVCEGHIHTPEEAQSALQAGAEFVVVGSAITDPVQITSWYVSALKAVD